MNYYLSIDIGGSYIKYSKVNRAGSLLGSKKVKTPDNLKSFLVVLKSILKENKDDISGVGVSAPGRIDIETGTVYHGGSLHYLHEFSIKKYVESQIDTTCVVSNDGKAAALAELWIGNLQDINYGAAIVLGTGVGGGLIAEGSILQGAHFQAGELSFIPNKSQILEDNMLIGQTGSAIEFVKQSSILLGLEDKTDGKEVFKRIIEDNNPELIKLFKEYCREISYIIFNLQAILDVTKVVIGGGISVENILIKTINAEYSKLRDGNTTIKHTFSPVEIERCKFGNEANLLGAIYQLFLTIDASN